MPEQDAAELEASGVRIQRLSRSAKEATTTSTSTITLSTSTSTIPKATAAIVDNKASLIIEIKDDSKGVFSDAIGSAVLSTSRSVVISYARIFESLWQEMEVAAQLKKMDIMQKEFINVAAHELRTPIMPILGIADMITSDDPDGTGDLKVTREEVDIIVRNAKRLQRLSSDILDVTKIESDTLALSKTRFALNEVMAGAIKDAQSHGQNADIQFILELSKQEYVKADMQRIGQVISNLLGNAAKFTKAGKVTVGAKSDGGVVTVTVTDTGAGIDPEILPKLFTKFTSKSETGTGLGLYISKKIVEAHGGKIWAENRPGGGALFCFTLPLDGTG
jgi:signal transduction histidine kinase